MYRTRKARRRQKRERKGTNVHHVMAVSRYPKLRHKKWNMVRLLKTEHELYHALFGLKNPREVIEYLQEHFWGGNFNVSPMQSTGLPPVVSQSRRQVARMA